MVVLHKPLRRCANGLMLLALGALLSGCADGIEFNGTIFNAVGLGGESKSAEPQVARRNGLVVPPDRLALPAPGSAPPVTTASVSSPQAWPKDQKEVKAAQAAQRVKLIRKYCNDKSWWMYSNPDEFNRMTQNGDLCQSALSKMVNE